MAIVAVAILLLVFTQRQAGGATTGAGAGSAIGTGPAGDSTTAAIGGVVGAGACIAGGAALGAPQAGIAASKLCGVIGKLAAPYVVKGAKEVAEGAEFVAKQTASAAVAGAKLGSAALNELAHNPLAAITAPTQIAGKLAGFGASKVNAALTGAYDHLDGVEKLAVAPVYIPTKLALKGVSLVSRLAQGGGGTLASGAKSAYHAVSSTVNSALGYIGL